MMARNNIAGYHPVGAPTYPCKQEVGKPSLNAAQPHAKAEGCVHGDLRADKLRKDWGFWVGTWNIDSLTGTAGELERHWQRERWMWRVFRRLSGEVVGVGSLVL